MYEKAKGDVIVLKWSSHKALLPFSFSTIVFYKQATVCQFSMASVSTQKACTSSSSSSSSTPLWEHDVFLSFYGEDTRKNFTDHLYTSLKQKGINAYRDNEKLEQGTPIASGLMKAIEESKYAIIVISENYAFSKWCLNELVKILECMKDKGLRILPVFYHVNPSDVGNQRETFEKAFLKHKEDPEVSIEKIRKWRAALTEVSKICGRHLIDTYRFTFYSSGDLENF